MPRETNAENNDTVFHICLSLQPKGRNGKVDSQHAKAAAMHARHETASLVKYACARAGGATAAADRACSLLLARVDQLMHTTPAEILAIATTLINEPSRTEDLKAPDGDAAEA